jgi:hypothetical protein
MKICVVMCPLKYIEFDEMIKEKEFKTVIVSHCAPAH